MPGNCPGPAVTRACALAHTYRCLAFVFSGRHAEAAEAELRAAALG